MYDEYPKKYIATFVDDDGKQNGDALRAENLSELYHLLNHGHHGEGNYYDAKFLREGGKIVITYDPIGDIFETENGPMISTKDGLKPYKQED